MATEARIRELNARHRQLKSQIETERKHPSADPLQLVTLKRQKLRLKEEIADLKRRTPQPS